MMLMDVFNLENLFSIIACDHVLSIVILFWGFGWKALRKLYICNIAGR